MKRFAFALMVCAAAPAHADETRTLTVVNDTSSAVNQLFVSGGNLGKLRAKVSGIFRAPEDEQDRLNAKMLPRGGNIVVSLKGDRCRYDIRAVLENGNTYTADDVDICAEPRWSITRGQRR